MRSSSAAIKSNLKADIKNRIKGKAAIVGIGNPLRGDDGFGPKFIEALKNKNIKAALFDCGTAPENYIFPILSTSCDTVILIDAADFGTAPGDIKVLGLNEVSNASFSTHNPSPRLFVDLLKTGRNGLNIFIISIQPKTTAFGESLSKEVKSSLDSLTGIFTGIFAQQ